MSDELELEYLVEQVDERLGNLTDSLVAAMHQAGEMSAKWEYIKGLGIENATDEDCAWFAKRFQKILHPRLGNAEAAGVAAHVQMGNIAAALDLNEGGGKCPPWDPEC